MRNVIFNYRKKTYGTLKRFLNYFFLISCVLMVTVLNVDLYSYDSADVFA